MKLSSVERLPPELLEIIFLEALEVNFARAFLKVATAVSRERVFEILLIHAFWNPRQRISNGNSTSRNLDSPLSQWDYHESRAFTKRLPCALYRILPPEHQKRLQATVTSCKWFNSRRLRVVQHTMLEMTLESVDSSIVRWEPYCYARQSRNTLSPIQIGDSLPVPRSVELCRNEPMQSIRVLDNFSFLVQRPESTKSFQTCTMFRFPEKALRGPWSNDRVDLLFNLWWNLDRKFKGTHFCLNRPAVSGDMVPEVCPSAYEEGIKNALKRRNTAVLLCLLDIRRCALLRSDESVEKARLPDEIFALALYYCTQKLDILQMLVQADLEWTLRRTKLQDPTSLPHAPAMATARDLAEAFLKISKYDSTQPRPFYNMPWPGIG
ncbi:hypothetical protein N7448_011389 [Penicillium atrosanguineum]|uniref:Uncharacterized protein n=1 Tax=Penicillium atrosanguineum TaxID=1132637 RepID=A0A9W9KTK0_9EURO|nr:hypothetical protein N7526_011498 [Penicillium atrosanguineum]KAJ5117757.1 hypothetical protein N7448_011389 [Penicillium atrosanguineum]KAJ5318707.1 hypothetical protein N7476_005127 [Penicillium atrosanguineum]